MINRSITKLIDEKLFKGKAIIILGARQTGKTTLLKKYQQQFHDQAIYMLCDEPGVMEMLHNTSTERWKRIIGDKKLVLIDEAQRIPNIGLALKLVTDNLPSVQLMVSGSSSLEIASTINEPLTGRKWEYHLYPVSWAEVINHFGYLEEQNQLEQRLIFGSYPEVVMNPGKEIELLNQIAGSYLYKDLLSYHGIRKPELLDQLLKALALQLGSEVSYNELSNLLGVDKNTVNQYISLLEKAFIIFRLNPLSRNMRNEIRSSRKIYFYDNGIRNTLVSNFNLPAMRQDTGQLWENFIISERIKYLHYHKMYGNLYFWRTHSQQEIDLIEERDGIMHAFECKFGKRVQQTAPASFIRHYPKSTFKLVTPENVNEFLI